MERHAFCALENSKSVELVSSHYNVRPLYATKDSTALPVSGVNFQFPFLFRLAEYVKIQDSSMVHYAKVTITGERVKSKREFLKKGFKYCGAKHWNQLPNEAKLAESMYSFNKCIKT